MQELFRDGVLLKNYWSLTHPSFPNYIASIGGDYFGLNHDGYVTIPQNISTVVDLLDTKGIEWKAYFEDLPEPGFVGPSGSSLTGQNLDYMRNKK